MNLHQIASGAVATVNPMVLCTLRVSTGFTTSSDGTRVPTYSTTASVPCQIQALTGGNLAHLDALGIQGVNNAIYLNGNIEGVDRAAIKGGDLFTFPDSSVWLVVAVLENWPGWTKVAVTRQLNGT